MTIDFNAVRQRHDLVTVVSHYIDIRPSGSRYLGLCPFHADTRPSFSIYRGDDGLYRYICFACKEQGDVIDFVAAINGVETVEAIKILTNDDLPSVGEYIPKKLPPNQSKDWEPICPVPEHATEYDPKVTFNPHQGKFKNYEYGFQRLDAYRNEEGKLMFYVLRASYEAGSKVTMAISWCIGPGAEERWCAMRPEPPHPILGLDRLAKYPDRKVILVSGEKCCAALQEEFPKYTVISWVGGDGAIKDTDWSPLNKVDSVLQWSDNDIPGKNAMNKISRMVDNMVERNGTG